MNYIIKQIDIKPTSKKDVLKNLTDKELIVYNRLLEYYNTKCLRIEQERIPWSYALEFLDIAK